MIHLLVIHLFSFVTKLLISLCLTYEDYMYIHKIVTKNTRIDIISFGVLIYYNIFDNL